VYIAISPSQIALTCSLFSLFVVSSVSCLPVVCAHFFLYLFVEKKRQRRGETWKMKCGKMIISSTTLLYTFNDIGDWLPSFFHIFLSFYHRCDDTYFCQSIQQKKIIIIIISTPSADKMTKVLYFKVMAVTLLPSSFTFNFFFAQKNVFVKWYTLAAA
jgi:hypothetical protein